MSEKLTKRQLIALATCYFGQSPHFEPAGTYGAAHEKAGQIIWLSRRSMGGATRRMISDLRDRGLLTERDYFVSERRHRPAWFEDESNLLTVRGYEVLQSHLGKLPKVRKLYCSDGEEFFQFTIDADELDKRKAQRAAREDEMRRLRAEERDRDRRRAEEQRERERAKTIANFKQLFKDYGLEADWSDERVLQFAEQAGDAVMI